METVRKNCEACFAPITVRLSDHKRGWGRFCDKACSAAYRSGLRPRDVNAVHAKYSAWAADRLAQRQADGVATWDRAPSVKSQAGRVRVRHQRRPPAKHAESCVVCGDEEIFEGRFCLAHHPDLDPHPFSEDAFQ